MFSFRDWQTGSLYMRRFILPGLMLALAAVVAINMAIAQDAEKPKHTIKEVMKAAHKDKLLNKVAGGNASKEEVDKLVELYDAMGKNKPPKGEAAAWETKTKALLAAAKDVQAGKEGAGPKLTMAANCANCHKDHKGP
jgi:hypothetical protein